MPGCGAGVGGRSHAPLPASSHIRVDAEDGRLSIDLPWETHKKETREFNQWLEHACAHPGMFQANERISNWAGVRAFQYAPRTINKEGFQNLLREIPDYNGGLTSPLIAKCCLQELDRFEAIGTFGRYVQLIDSDTGSFLMDRIEAYDGWFLSNSGAGHQFSLDGDGHFRIDHDQLGIVFRAKEIAQNRTSDGQFIYMNLVDGTQYVCPDGIRDYETSEYPLRLRGLSAAIALIGMLTLSAPFAGFSRRPSRQTIPSLGSEMLADLARADQD